MRTKSPKTFNVGKIIRGKTIKITVGVQKNCSMIRIQRRKSRPNRMTGGRSIRKTTIMIQPKELSEFIYLLEVANRSLIEIGRWNLN